MSLFKPAENTMAYFKAGFMGEAGSGKTHTATLAMIGLIKHLRAKGIPGSDKPVFMLDTEQGSAWIKPMFDDAGIPFYVHKTRVFKDLVPAIREAEKEASGLLIDSVTHFWEELKTTYATSKPGRSVLEFQDWAVLKSMWSKFSDAYVNSELHCVLCGRLGHEYEQVQDERTGKKKIEQSGVKMQAEKGLGYEPNILIWMEREMDLTSKTITRKAIVLKDRSQRLDGEQYPNPTFQTFLPHIDYLALGGKHEGVDTSRTSGDIIPDDDAPLSDMKSIRRGIVLDEIEALLVKHYPSTSAAEKQAKAALVLKHFRTSSWTEISKLMPLYDLQKGYNDLHQQLEEAPSRYETAVTPAPPVNDEIPEFVAPVAAEAKPPKYRVRIDREGRVTPSEAVIQ
ncbi:AAA family ATPase [uncultured Hyphomicrobium sp.]|uniref:AAA family ATPase n=1 Tax=uncultured Hyphomicrobium sp. TaxID=194373 RepID=UPI0025D6309A|nr:AAA family ATPase [uncultured Hyphomicrobium sp.]